MCAVGQYIAGGTCCTCPENSYCVGDNTQNACPAFSSTDGLTGSTSSTACKCDAGYSGPDGGTCLICGANYYKATAGSAPCTGCPSPSTTDTVEGATSAGSCLCPPGYAGDLAIDAQCTGCENGYAKPDLGPGACYECAARDAHSASIDNLASVACQCVAGYAWNGLICEACPVAYYKDAVGNIPLSCALDPGELYAFWVSRRQQRRTRAPDAPRARTKTGLEAGCAHHARREGQRRVCRARTSVHVSTTQGSSRLVLGSRHARATPISQNSMGLHAWPVRLARSAIPAAPPKPTVAATMHWAT